MKYICLGDIGPDKFENMSESERNTVLDECFSYSDELRKNRHLVAEEPLQPANTAVTVYWKNPNNEFSLSIGQQFLILRVRAVGQCPLDRCPSVIQHPARCRVSLTK